MPFEGTANMCDFPLLPLPRQVTSGVTGIRIVHLLMAGALDGLFTTVQGDTVSCVTHSGEAVLQ